MKEHPLYIILPAYMLHLPSCFSAYRFRFSYAFPLRLLPFSLQARFYVCPARL